MNSTKELSKEGFKYRNLLCDVIRTNLLYNDKELLGKHIGNNSLSNNNSPSKWTNEFKIVSTFHELSAEVLKASFGAFQLENLLTAYAEASDLFVKHIQRSYSFKVNCSDTSPKNSQKKEIIFAYLNYLCDESEIGREQLKNYFRGEKDWLDDIFDEDGRLYYHKIAFLLLIWIGILPPYYSRSGAVKDIRSDANSLVSFLKEYASQSPSADKFGDTPILTRFENEIQKEYHVQKKENPEKSESELYNLVINRLKLILLTDEFLSIISGYSSNNQTKNLVENIEYVFLDEIDGFWQESAQGVNSCFWEIKTLANCYHLIKYECKRNSNDRYEIFMTPYELYLYYHRGNLIAYIVHPKASYDLIRTGILQGFQFWAYCDYKKSGQQISIIKFDATINKNNWFKLRTLYKVNNDNNQYKDIIANNRIIPNDYISYFELHLFAITYDYLYIDVGSPFIEIIAKDENFGNVNHILMKIPKRINEVLKETNFSSTVGLVKFKDGACYYGDSSALLFINVTNKEDREKYGIRLTLSIDE